MSDAAEFPPPAILDTPRLLIATDAGYHPIVRLATKSQHFSRVQAPVLVLFGAGDSFPFKPRPSTILVSGMPAGVIACVPSLDEFGVASRLASTAGLPGCYDGPVTELGELWLQSLDPAMLAQVQIIVSGADETVRAAEELGRRLDVPVDAIPVQGMSP